MKTLRIEADFEARPKGQAEPDISIIVPILDEESNIPSLYSRLLEALQALEETWEVIFVNDGSTDRSAGLLDALAEKDSHITIVHFRRNFGQTAAIAAGIRYSRGKIILPMDGDLQNDPGDIRRLLQKMREGLDVVSGWRKDRKDPLTKKLPSRWANALISFVTGIRLHDYGCTLKAYRREVLDGISFYGEMHRFLPALASMRGARIGEIIVQHHPRTAGKSHYGLERTGKVLLDLILVRFFLSFRNKPMYFFGGLAGLSLAGALASLVTAVALRFIPAGSLWYERMRAGFLEESLPFLSLVLGALGIIALLQGILAEIVTRALYQFQGKEPFAILRIHHNSRQRTSTVCPESEILKVVGSRTHGA